MILATQKDKETAVRIITNTFDANPSVNVVIGKKGNRRKKLTRLAEYAFVKALSHKGVFLSSNNKGVAFCYRSNNKSPSLKELYSEFCFALVIPLDKSIKALKREAYLKKHRYTGEHFYFWFFGVEQDGGKAGFEIKDHLFQLSKEQQLPILLETSVARNKLIYERYGFKVYHKWADHDENHTLWLMMREV